MSKAFTKETDDDGAAELPDRIVPPHPNLVTPEGLAAADAAIEQLSLLHAQALAEGDAHVAASTARDLRYWTAQRSNAQIVPPPPDNSCVYFGSTVTIVRDNGRRDTWRIVGEDEADPAHGTLSHVAPVARALLGRQIGDVVQAGNSEAEIVEIGSN